MLKIYGIGEMSVGDYVKFRDKYFQIRNIFGVSPSGRLNKPSEGGFYVTTVDGPTVDMWQAQSYHKKEDVEALQAPPSTVDYEEERTFENRMA